jgi:hypothetical protein
MITEFDTLENYTNIAKKTISKFASKFYPGLSKEMLNNDETVAEVASAIMMADWNWDRNRKGKNTGLGKSMYSYRNQCAIWAIKTYITSKFKKIKNKLNIMTIIVLIMLRIQHKTQRILLKNKNPKTL